MIRGHLRILTLKVLGEGVQTGYSLIKGIDEKTSWKPSFGSIYPLLEQLSEQGVVKYKEENNKKKYSLTAKGKKELEEAFKKKEEILEKIGEAINTYRSLHEDKTGKLQTKLLNLMKKGEINLESMPPEMVELKETILKLVINGKLKTHRKTITSILKKTNTELKKIK
ncbi:PadR family transcriptional regulator [archaeon]|nr:PadR family transcriptional regulator [archaeon]